MIRRNEQPAAMRPYDWDNNDRPLGPGLDRTSKLLLAGIVAIIVGGLTALAWDAKAGAETRPDYAALGDQAPDVTVFELHPDGTAHVEFTIPAGATPQVWHVATFHVPDPADWHVDQQLIDGGPTGPLGPGLHTFTLRTAPGACQVDLYLDGEVEPYASDTSQEHGWDTCAPAPVEDDITPDSFASPLAAPTPAVPIVPAVQDSAPALAGTSASGGLETLNVEVAVAAVSSVPSQSPAGTSTRTLPNTGRSEAALLVLACLLILVGTGCVRIGRRS